MIVKCEKCEARFDDQFRSTVCPHDPFPVNNGDNTFTVHHDSFYVPADKPWYDAPQPSTNI
jgi:RecB family endonuclease NucS